MGFILKALHVRLKVFIFAIRLSKSQNNTHLVSHFGGHAAAGLTLKNNFDEFKTVFIQTIAEMDAEFFMQRLYGPDGEVN